ncbi:MAG: DUF4250 domain-containing protein [Clostridiales bacterium]|uniref:Uncharacterized protein DUF4250 n=1 Tax=Harryflintia acetispora TaxID=1849041 RepID=A0A9X8UL33_9FIRM|nr:MULTISPECIES: DUF4250 domain-containing protein [Oscillospiraceae]PWM36739.1 MAG: DUF4250 domain-containing protein [Clostridiales bacterium]RGB64488.1 DUF4250 domain-containing protein [Harryflintia acetispora]TCL45041.1 uncharacterized protein DUF4250 [Harryflintia acetispora]
MQLPKDPVILLGVINTRLRDYYPNLGALCEECGIDEGRLRDTLRGIGYEYDGRTNQFK